MEIVFFHWAINNGPSITRSFMPLIEALKKDNKVIEYRVPYEGANPINVIRNIIFVYKHRSKSGINHITGDIHYCVLGLLGVKSVLTIHDDYAIIKAPNIFNKIYKYIFWIYLPIKLSNQVVYITEATKKKIERYVKSNNAIVITQHSIRNGYVYSPYVFNNRKPRILQIGVTYQKNLETTIYALKGLNCHLRIIKKIHESQYQLLKKMDIDFSNAYNLSDHDIIEEYKKADIVVFPSLFEGFGMPIIEAQAIGRPIVTSDIAPMNWVAGNGAWLLKNPLDIEEYRSILLEVINNSVKRNEKIKQGLENIKRFSIKTITEKYIELYNSVLIHKKQ